MRRLHLGFVCLALNAGCEAASPPGDRCTTVGFESEVAVSRNNAVDLLIVIDDSSATDGERAVMQRELARLVRVAVTGELSPGVSWFDPQRDMRVGVLSADLGASGVAGMDPACEGWGDGGAFVSSGAGEACPGRAPAFLRYRVPTPTEHPLVAPPSDEPVRTLLADFECAAAADGPACGFGQPFEAMLRALWPAAEDSTLLDQRPAFDGPPPAGDGANAGFLRNDRGRSFSFLHILLVTDGDDCSAGDPDALFAGDDAAGASSAQVRCAANPQLLHAVERYVAGLRALRPDYEYLVSFAAIAGVPTDLLGSPTNPIDFRDDVQRDALYAAVLADPRMQATPQADGTLVPSCESDEISATPPQRVVELARGLGPMGRVHSICSDDWSGALDALTETIAFGGNYGCMPRTFPRDRDGLAPCRVLWELPPPEQAPEGTPTACSDRAYLSPHEPRRSDLGGVVCEVRQLAVLGTPDDPQLEPGEGWFYDDFSIGAPCYCPVRCNSIFFVPDELPSGVNLKLQCLETLRSLPPRSDLQASLPQADVFDRCDPDDSSTCARFLTDSSAGLHGDGIDDGLRCHPHRHQCLPACDAQPCPAGWSCSAENFCEPDECTVP